MVIAHGRGLFPPHLVGCGVPLLNLFGIGGSLTQFSSGRIHEIVPGHASAATSYAAIFGFFGLALLIGTLIYGDIRVQPRQHGL